MSLCRPLIFQVHAPKLSCRQLTANTLYSASAAATRVKTTRPNVPVSGATHVRHASRSTKGPPFLIPPSLPRATRPSNINPISLTVPDEVASLTPGDYQERRDKDRNSVANLSDTSYLRVVSQALKDGRSTIADSVALDILEVFQGDAFRQENILRELLSHDLVGLSPNVLWRILQYLRGSPCGLETLSTASISSVARAIVEDSSVRDSDQALAQLIHPIFVGIVNRYSAPGGVQSVNYHPPSIISVAFSMVHKLLAMELHEQALELFQTLVKSRHIPPEAIHEIQSSSTDFKTVITTTVVRASLHWRWRPLAIIFIGDLLNTVSPDPYILELNNDVIYSLLDAPTPRNIRICNRLIEKAHKHRPVPHTIIRLFYERSEALGAASEAEGLYAFTRTPRVFRTHRYPPPQGSALPWLMSHLASTSRKPHLSRVLAAEVVQDNLPIPSQHCAKFIAATASQGYGTLARSLWERYATGKNPELVVGDSTLMIRMVSLFRNLSKRTTARHREQLAKEGAPPSKTCALEEQIRDLDTFLHRVLSAFKGQHPSLADAPHQVVTSTARANFILGKFAEGFHCFKILAQRKELSDMHDVNVLLSGLCQLRPGFALRLVKKMEKRGLRPDAVTFGTILHHALLRRDEQVVEEMIERIRGLDGQPMTLKSLVGLIRATIMPLADESREKRLSRLRMALHLIKSFPDTNISASSQMGKHLVYQALTLKDGRLAYKFWEACLRTGAEWRDREQWLLRKLIARTIERDQERLGRQEVARMVHQLDCSV